jgi:tRNA threonylcarbamoyladenosine biosynthesis protein TsaB
MGRLLAIDCSTERLVLGLCDGDERAWTCDEEGGARASARLLSAVRELLAQARLELGMLDAIAFAAGPGAFTGLRTACAAAQGFALGAGKPVLPLDSLAIVAEDARTQGAPAHATGWVALDARMGEVYAGAYRWRDGARWQAVHDSALWSPEALAQAWAHEAPAWVAGSALDVFAPDRLPSGAASRWPLQRDRAAALLELARAAWRDGAAVDAAQALPRYVRDKVALTTAERDAARAAAPSTS